MRTLLLALSLSFVGCTGHSVRSFTARDAADVRAVLLAQRDAWNRGDLRAFMAGYLRSDQLIFTSGATIRRGWTATLASYQQRYGKNRASMGKLSFEILDVRGLGADGAVVLGRWQLRDTPQAASGVFSVVLERDHGRWRVVHDHTSVKRRSRPQPAARRTPARQPQPSAKTFTFPGCAKAWRLRRGFIMCRRGGDIIVGKNVAGSSLQVRQRVKAAPVLDVSEYWALLGGACNKPDRSAEPAAVCRVGGWLHRNEPINAKTFMVPKQVASTKRFRRQLALIQYGRLFATNSVYAWMTPKWRHTPILHRVQDLLVRSKLKRPESSGDACDAWRVHTPARTGKYTVHIDFEYTCGSPPKRTIVPLYFYGGADVDRLWLRRR